MTIGNRDLQKIYQSEDGKTKRRWGSKLSQEQDNNRFTIVDPIGINPTLPPPRLKQVFSPYLSALKDK